MRNHLKNDNIKKYPKWFYLIALVIPIVFILLLELILNLFNYGTDYTTFVKISNQFENYKFFNPKLPQKYFGSSPITPAVIPDGFTKDKSTNTYRIFALGGSTTAGFPHPPNGSFPRLLKNLLSNTYPKINFEVINLGISAVNTITLRDIIDDVIVEKPDLVIFYAGHNEYYGALGPASNVSSHLNLPLTRFVLRIKEFKIVQLIENFLSIIISTFQDNGSSNKTLMSEIAGENLVPLDSDKYYKGIEQFKSNLTYILEKCADKNIPTMVGTLVSNLLQEPLCKFSGCDSLLNEYKVVTSDLNAKSKRKLYLIKDRDELRFRAPEVFNQIIIDLAKKYNIIVFDTQERLEEISDKGIIGNSLVMDHLHPTYEGNKIIANLILNEIKNLGLNKFEFDLDFQKENSVIDTLKFNSYSALDSTFAYLRIQYLKNDFPFTNPHFEGSKFKFNPKNIVESLAHSIITGEKSWETAHAELANYHLGKRNYKNYVNEMNVLIEDKPFVESLYINIIQNLERANQFELLTYILLKYYNYFPKLLSAKKLGDIYYRQKEINKALYFYNKSLVYSTSEPEIYFNISSIYFTKKNLPEAFKNIKSCLTLNPNYPNAKRIYDGLLKMLKSNNK